MTDGRPPLAATPWTEAAEWAADSLLAVPVGATEQHGPHLPVGTDTVVAEALARGLADRRPDVTVAPAVAYGASGEHAAFPGTLSIGTEVTAALLVELVRSADDFRGVLLVCGHGGNAEALAVAGRRLESEGRPPLVWAPRADTLASVAETHDRPADAHAGWVETSILLAVAPALVRAERGAPGDPRPVGQLAAELRRVGVRPISPSGVLGDPTGASPEAGWVLLQACVDDLAAAVAARWGPPRPPERPPLTATGPRPPGRPPR